MHYQPNMHYEPNHCEWISVEIVQKGKKSKDFYKGNGSTLLHRKWITELSWLKWHYLKNIF